MIYTSYFENLKNLPDTIVPIAICGNPPQSYQGLVFKKLAPQARTVHNWRAMRGCGNKEADNYYTIHFYMDVLAPLNPYEVVSELGKMAHGKDIVLICDEKPDVFCHRTLVMNWLHAYGFFCEEFDKEKYLKSIKK